MGSYFDRVLNDYSVVISDYDHVSFEFWALSLLNHIHVFGQYALFSKSVWDMQAKLDLTLRYKYFYVVCKLDP